jgi:hypothetical protein
MLAGTGLLRQRLVALLLLVLLLLPLVLLVCLAGACTKLQVERFREARETALQPLQQAGYKIR